jgi:hypothetical protein
VRLKNNLPTVPVDDIVIHPRENDLVLGTHGRGVWIMGDITPLEELTSDVLASAAHLFSIRSATSYNLDGRQGWTPGVFEAPEPQYGALIRYYLRDDLTTEVMTGDSQDANGGGPRAGMPRGEENGGAVTITIVDQNGETIRELEGSGKAGGHEVVWDLRLAPPYETAQGQGQGGGFRFRAPRGPTVLPGTYTVRLEAAGQTLTRDVTVRGDPRIQISRVDLESRQRAMMSAYRLAKPNYEAGQALQRITQQLGDVRRLLREASDVPESISQEVDSLQSEVGELQQELRSAAQGAGAAFSIEASTSRPTTDQLWQLDQSWELLPSVIERINEVINTKMPALYGQLDQHGIRPDPGKAVTVPTRRGR